MKARKRKKEIDFVFEFWEKKILKTQKKISRKSKKRRGGSWKKCYFFSELKILLRKAWILFCENEKEKEEKRFRFFFWKGNKFCLMFSSGAELKNDKENTTELKTWIILLWIGTLQTGSPFEKHKNVKKNNSERERERERDAWSKFVIIKSEAKSPNREKKKQENKSEFLSEMPHNSFLSFIFACNASVSANSN